MGSAAAAAVDSLLVALNDQDAEVRAHAAAALGNIGKDAARALPELLGRLRDEASQVRYHAADAVSDISVALGQPAPEVVLAVASLLGDEQGYVRRTAAMALGRMGSLAASGVPELLQALEDPLDTVRTQAVVALPLIGGGRPDIVAALGKALADANWLVRSAAADALAGLGSGANLAVPELISALDDWELAANAGRALGAIGPPAADPLLSVIAPIRGSNLGSAATQTLRAVAEAFGLIAAAGELPRDAFRCLSDCLVHPAWPVRAAAAAAFENVGVEMAPIPGLIQSLADPAGEVRAAAEKTLKALAFEDEQAAAGSIARQRDAAQSGSEAMDAGRSG